MEFLISLHDNLLIYYPNIFFVLSIIFLLFSFIFSLILLNKIILFAIKVLGISWLLIKILKEIIIKIMEKFRILKKFNDLIILCIPKLGKVYVSIDKRIVFMSFSRISLFSFLIIYFCQLLIINIFPPRIPTTAINFNLNKPAGKTKIVYFVDSVNDTADKLDKSGKAISIFLEHLLDCKIGVLGQPAAQPDVEVAYAMYISRLNPLPDYLIVEINMRAFSPPWDEEPQYQFEEQKRYFRFFADTPLMPFWSFFSDNTFFGPDSLPKNKYQNIAILNRLQEFGLMRDTKKTKTNLPSGDPIRDSIEGNYMYNLTKDHRKVQSLLEIADIFASKKTKLIFYFTPIDYQPKVVHIGNDFKIILKKNVDLIKSLLLRKHVTVLDLSMNLPTKAPFTWREDLYNSEHLAEQGRRFVAQSLANEIQNQEKGEKLLKK